LLVYSLTLATLLSACSIIPWESPLSSGGVSTKSDSVGPDDTPEFVGGVVEREIQVGVPAGGLEGAVEGELTVGLNTRTPAPFPDVQFTIGDPINEKVLATRVGNTSWEWEFPVPDDCQQGCKILIPVAIEKVGEGEPPGLSWSASLYFEYEFELAPEDPASNMTVDIVPAGD
jgi:hypothetical protein